MAAPSPGLRNISQQLTRRMSAKAREENQYLRTKAAKMSGRNGSFDGHARQLSQVRLRPCGASMGNFGCTTVL